jgi:phosphatidylglycerophosphatase A
VSDGPAGPPADERRAATASGGLDSLAYLLAIWFGCGLVPRMPGTIGTLGALPVYFLVVRWAGPAAVGLAALLLTLVAVAVSGRVVRRLGVKDPQIICIDEVAGVMVALTAAPSTWPGVVVAVVLFRLFDMTKPWPARALEELPGGWGVVLDDVAAGVWAALLVLGARSFALL